MADCPTCKSRMRSIVEDGTTLDACDDCHSVWLDSGELNALTKNTDFRPGEVDIERRHDLNCPRCHQNGFADVETSYGTLSRCISCGGVFVSGETLDALNYSDDKDSSGKVIARKCSLPTEIAALVAEILKLFTAR